MNATPADVIRSRLKLRHDLPPPERCKELREAAGLSQQDIADAVGVTRQAVGHWETGFRRPGGPALGRYMEALRVLEDAAAR
jgi:transcriptional regulator with XRE-family HTH domain